ncbi:MAG: substrate-binding domain-containing protein [Acidobacteriales bacterium]|nr:substrate-binding domain-containing protein [Terriglobales bacterium]
MLFTNAGRMIAAVGLLCCLLALSPACNRSKKKAIAVIPMGRAHMFWQSVHAGAVAASREAGVDIIWNGPAAETDYTDQIRIVESMISRHVDAIALAPIDSKAMVGVVERAVREGIPVILFDSGLDSDVFLSRVATDNYGAGRLGADRMAKILNGKGKVAMVASQPGAASSTAREKGFEDGIHEKYPGIQIVDKRYGMADFAKSLAVAENMLTAFPDLDGLFSSNEAASVGAAQALKGRPGTKVKMVGFDWNPTLLDGLETGLIDSLIVQQPFQMGYEAVMSAMKKFRGEPVPKIHDLAPRLITRENMKDPDVQAQINPDLKKYLE